MSPTLTPPPTPFPAPERALPAQTRLDDYEIERVLARSNFALIYRAYDHALKLHVAIKEYLPDALALRSTDTQLVLRSRSLAERFERGLEAFVAEAQTLARCEHPSLLRIVRILRAHGTVYRVMRYAPGPTLLEQRQASDSPPRADALHAWLDGALGALAELHEEGCVHGAIEPDNVLLLADGRLLLLDFDAVRGALISDTTQDMMAALQPCFKPTELRLPGGDQLPGPWSDLYALAATLHFAIGGQLPAPRSLGGTAPAREPLAALWQRCHGAAAQGATAQMLAALQSCLAETASARPQSVAELRLLLRGATAAVPIAPPVAVPITRPVERTPTPEPPTPPPATPAQTPGEASASVTRGAEASHASVMADLDRTFAFIAAKANEPAEPDKPAPADVPAAAAPLPEAPPPMRRWWIGLGVAVLVVAAAVGDWLLSELSARLPTSSRAASGVATHDLPSVPGSTAPLELPPTSAGRSEASTGIVTLGEPSAPSPKPTPAPAAEPPAKSAAPPPGKPRAARSPREVCGERTQFSLYQCMQTQCAKAAWSAHAQCVKLRKTDSVD